MDERWILIDEETGLHVSWYFWLRVLDEVNRSARYGAPFGLLLLEATAAPGSHRRAVEQAAAALPAAIRSTDLGGILGDARAGIMLTHQDATSAETAAQRILERIEHGKPHGVTWEWRLLTYPHDGAEISQLLTTGWVRPPAEGARHGMRQPA